MRAGLKSVIERTLNRSGLSALARRRKGGDALVLAYHNIVPHGSEIKGDLSLHLPQAEFARQLDLIQRTHAVVPLKELLDTDRRAGLPRAAITFDDACQGAMTAGLAELASRSLPATIFVAPAFVGGRSFWWDALSGEEGLPPAVREQALNMLGGEDAEVRGWASRNGYAQREVPSHQTAATEEQLHAADRTPGISFGSHTWSHPNLTRIPDSDLRDELERPLVWLRERFRSVVPWLAYPYGLAAAREFAAAAAAGYDSALLVEGGWLPPGPTSPDTRFSLPRLNVPAGVSLDGFELRVSGVIGA